MNTATRPISGASRSRVRRGAGAAKYVTDP